MNLLALRSDNRRMLGKLVVVAGVMFGFGYALVPMYRAICEALGINVLTLNEQRKVLDQASEFVRPGGRMVYVTCSFFAEENEQQVEAFLARNDAFKLRKIDLFPDFTTAQGYLRLSPRTAGTDGFFAALLDRKK